MNILTFDIEEWFHLLDNDSTRSEEQWKGFEVRIYENMERIFRILEETDTKATFFVIGWIAKTYPDIVRQIASKYQVGSHTMNHQLVWQQSREAFKEDVSSSIKLLEKVDELLEENHVFIENIDATIIAQKPKMRPHIEQMEKNIAAALKISEDQINVKATTEEGLGFTGTEQGISAQAICALTTIYESSVSVADSAGGCAGCPGRACGR